MYQHTISPILWYLIFPPNLVKKSVNQSIPLFPTLFQTSVGITSRPPTFTSFISLMPSLPLIYEFFTCNPLDFSSMSYVTLISLPLNNSRKHFLNPRPEPLGLYTSITSPFRYLCSNTFFQLFLFPCSPSITILCPCIRDFPMGFSNNLFGHLAIQISMFAEVESNSTFKFQSPSLTTL